MAKFKKGQHIRNKYNGMVYIWFSCISAFMYGIGVFDAIIEVISKYKYSKKLK